jgi:hypothetical protein
MALDPDRELLRIYADPSLSPADKARLLGGDGGIPMPEPLPPEQGGGLPAGAVAGPGGGAGGTSGADDSGPGNQPAVPTVAGSGGAPSMDAQAGATTGVTGGGADIPVTGATSEPSAADQQKHLTATLSPDDLAAQKAAHPEMWGGAPSAPPGTSLASYGPGGAQSAPGDYRGALRLLSPAQGGAAVPMEQVHQSTSLSGSSVDPGQIAALKEAKERADADEMQKQIAEARIAQRSGDIQLAAEKQAQAEKLALSATRQQALARADQILAQQERIGQQIINTGPIMPGTMSSDNWSDTLFTVLSIFGSAAGASSPEKAAEAVGRIADREVARQKAEVDKNKGDFATLDTLYGKHLENLKDHELAKQATIADIYGRAQAEIQGMIQENGQAPDSVINRKLQAQASALGAQRAEFMADVQAKLGPKVEQQEAVSFVRKHLEAKPPAAAPVAAPSSAPAGVRRPAGHGPVAPASMAPKKSSEDTLNQAAELWNSGNPRDALALLPPTVKTAVLAQAARSQKGLGDGATREDAIAYALHDMSNGQFQIPKEFIPQSAREKLVQIPGGAQGFAASKSQADKLQNEFNADASLVSAYSQLEQLTKLPASAWTPELRARIEAITTLIKPMTSVSLGQGAMSTEEQTLYSGVSGGDINSIKDFMLGTGKAMAHQALQVARGRMRARSRSLSTDPFDFKPIEGE